MRKKNSTFFLTGGTGFVGSEVVKLCLSKSSTNRVFIQTRFPERYQSSPNCRYVSSYADVPPEEEIDVLINLAGAPIADKAWSSERKLILENSRIGLTHALSEQLRMRPPPRTVVSASAIGYYGTGSDAVDEKSPHGDGYAAHLCQAWEKEAMSFAAFSRLVIMRLGVVIGQGGVLSKLLPLYRLGLGGKIGAGDQWLSWVAMADVLSFIWDAIENESLQGVYNVCAPSPVQQAEFATCLARALSRPAVLTTPAFVLKMVYGEMAQELLIAGQKVMPSRLIENGFDFVCPDLESAISVSV